MSTYLLTLFDDAILRHIYGQYTKMGEGHSVVHLIEALNYMSES
jgi:hypothetical protein